MIHVQYAFADLWACGVLGLWVKLDRNSLIPFETTGTSVSFSQSCNETFGINKRGVHAEHMKIQYFCVLTEMSQLLR